MMKAPSKSIRARYPKTMEFSKFASFVLGALLLSIFALVIFLIVTTIRALNTDNLPYALIILSSGLGLSYYLHDSRKHWYETQHKLRENETICDFARSFDYRSVDTHVIRAVYELLQPYYRYGKDKILPVRADDNIYTDIDIDYDDIDFDMLYDLLRATKRDIKDIEKNPYYGKVATVRDLVMLINLQPKKDATDIEAVG